MSTISLRDTVISVPDELSAKPLGEMLDFALFLQELGGSSP